MNRKRSFGVALAIALLTLLLAASVAPAKTTPFQGTWESIDPTDDSNQRLIVSGGSSDKQLHAVYYDDGTGLAYGVDPETGEPLYAGLGVGVAEVDGNQLTITLKFFRCLGPPKTIYTPVLVLEYDASSDTLVWPMGVWERR